MGNLLSIYPIFVTYVTTYYTQNFSLELINLVPSRFPKTSRPDYKKRAGKNCQSINYRGVRSNHFNQSLFLLVHFSIRCIRLRPDRTHYDTYEYNSREGIINYVVLGGHTIFTVVSSLCNLRSSKEGTLDLSGFGRFV